MLVAVADPLNLEPLEELRMMLDSESKQSIVLRDAILNAINEAYARDREQHRN